LAVTIEPPLPPLRGTSPTPLCSAGEENQAQTAALKNRKGALRFKQRPSWSRSPCQ